MTDNGKHKIKIREKIRIRSKKHAKPPKLSFLIVLLWILIGAALGVVVGAYLSNKILILKRQPPKDNQEQKTILFEEEMQE